MTLITTLLGGSWHWLAALAGVLAALCASYFGGKKIGKVQQKARSYGARHQHPQRHVGLPLQPSGCG